jgi:hypothetical protein
VHLGSKGSYSLSAGADCGSPCGSADHHPPPPPPACTSGHTMKKTQKRLRAHYLTMCPMERYQSYAAARFLLHGLRARAMCWQAKSIAARLNRVRGWQTMFDTVPKPCTSFQMIYGESNRADSSLCGCYRNRSSIADNIVQSALREYSVLMRAPGCCRSDAPVASAGEQKCRAVFFGTGIGIPGKFFFCWPA